MGSVVTAGRLGGVMVSTLARNTKDVGLIPTPFSSPARHWFHDQDPIQAMCYMVVEPTLRMCVYG